jgi:hypothetical protein
MVSGVRSSCESLPPSVRKYRACSSRRASSRSKARASAPISSALRDSGISSRIRPSLPTAESAAERSRPMRTLMKVARLKANTTASAVASKVRLKRCARARSRRSSS